MNFQKNLIFRYLCTDQEGDLGAVHEPLLGPQHLATARSACPSSPASGGSPALTPGKLLPPAIRSLGQGPPEHVSEDVVFCVYCSRLSSEIERLERPLKLRLFLFTFLYAPIFKIDMRGNVISLSGKEGTHASILLITAGILCK